jgi:ferredoxin
MKPQTTRKIVRIDEEKCDGCAACVRACAEGALEIAGGKARLVSESYCDGFGFCLPECPRGAITLEDAADAKETPQGGKTERRGALAQWPVQLALVPSTAPFLAEADLLLAADCVAFACATFHEDLLKGRALLVACPKLDDFKEHLEKLTEILSRASPKSLTVVHMEVPCCSGLKNMARQALAMARRDIPLREVTIGTAGDVTCPAPKAREV